MVERPEHAHYHTLLDSFQRSIDESADFLFESKLLDAEINRLEDETEVPRDALLSFLRNLHTYYVKKTAASIQSSIKTKVLPRFVQGESIPALARDVRFPPFLLARYLVMEMTTLPKNKINKVIKAQGLDDKSLYKVSYATEAPRLAAQVQAVVQSDPLYSPRHDFRRHLVGIEYEVLLEHELRKLCLAFQSEKDLRDRGNAKTPDVCLSIPVAIRQDGEWRQIQWIDSKAMFGDADTHRVSVLPQAETYLHRYGPGLIVYWFGHAPMEMLDRAQGDVSVCGWELPYEFLLPTGQILRRT